MTIHVLVEGPSERAFIEPFARRLLGGHPVKVHPHQGKGALPARVDGTPNPRDRSLLQQLPAKLRAFAAAPAGTLDGVLVLVDIDDDDRDELERDLDAVASACAPGLRFERCLAVEETEAFYLGDLAAVERVFPNARMTRARQYVPDSICGTWELFGSIVQDDGGNKVAWAEAMGPAITTVASRSRSPSFRVLLAALKDLLPAAPARKKRRGYRHPPKKRGDTGRRR